MVESQLALDRKASRTSNPNHESHEFSKKGRLGGKEFVQVVDYVPHTMVPPDGVTVACAHSLGATDTTQVWSEDVPHFLWMFVTSIRNCRAYLLDV